MRHLTAQAAETEQIGAFAAQALADIHNSLYGEAPEATRAWTDGDAIMLVMRLAPASPARRGELPLTSIQRLVGAAVYRRTGVSLRTAGTNADAERGLVVLAFERLRAAGSEADEADSIPARPVLGAD